MKMENVQQSYLELKFVFLTLVEGTEVMYITIQTNSYQEKMDMATYKLQSQNLEGEKKETSLDCIMKLTLSQFVYVCVCLCVYSYTYT